MRRKWAWITASLVAFIALVTLALWVGTRPRSLELKVLKGVPVHEFRPAEIMRNGEPASSRTVYCIEADYNEAVRSISADLPGWTSISGLGNMTIWHEKAGPFQAYGRRVIIRPNIVDPDSMLVYGSGADSHRWVTIWVSEGRKEPNFLRGLYRAVTGNRHW